MHRITTGWTFLRALYGVMGMWVLVQAILAKEWAFGVFGLYFLSMGIFGFGCAAGNCAVPMPSEKKNIL